MNPVATGLDVYEQANIGYAAPAPGAPAGTWREVPNVCIDCHHNLSGYYYTRGNVEDGHPVKHPGTDSERGSQEPINKYAWGTDPAHWVAGDPGLGFSVGRLPFIVSGATSYAEATTVAENNEVFCLSCHKAHGSDEESSLRWSYREDGDNAGCQQCHNKGD